MRPIRPTLLGIPLALIVLTGCGPVDVTAQRLESSLATVFANYYVQEQTLTGHPGVAAAAVHATASCDKGGPTVPDRGAGSDWACLLDWTEPLTGIHHTEADPDHPATRADVKVNYDACFEAALSDVEPGVEAVAAPTATALPLGPLLLPRPGAKPLANPVREFDGCFDVFDGQTRSTHAPVPTPTPRPTPTPTPGVTAAPGADDAGDAGPTPSSSPSATRTPTGTPQPTVTPRG
jgi:hypothetical protein